MSIGEYCNREVVIASRDESVREAVRLMRNRHVGDVVVVEYRDNLPMPIGILTDRDIVIGIIAGDADVDSFRISDVMSYDLVTVSKETDLLEAISLMRMKGIRRLPVVDGQGALVGILTVDDVIEILAEELSGIANLIVREQGQEKRERAS